MSKGTLFSCSIVFLFITGCATSSVIPMGTDVYMVSSSGAGFDTGGVRSNVYEAANKFCDKSRQSLKAVSYESVKGKLASHPPSAELMFKCVKKTDNVDLLSLAEENQTQPSEKMSSEKKDIYTELMKLNELKEKGIITEEEFKLEKSKILHQ